MFISILTAKITAYSAHAVKVSKYVLVVIKLTKWNKTDEKLMQTVKSGSVDNVLRLAARKTLEPTKLDPSRGTTA